MFTSIRTYRVGQGSIADAMHLVDVGLADAFAREPGFVSYQVVQTGERRFYGNILLTKGVVAPEEQA